MITIITVRIGESVEYIGRSRLSRANGTHFEAGSRGVVVEVHGPRRGVGLIIIDDEEHIDEDRQGYAVVDFEGWGRRIIWASAKGKDWRPL